MNQPSYIRVPTKPALFVLLLCLSSTASAKGTWYVDLNGVAPGTGTAADPYTKIQYAIDQPSTVNGDQLEVHPGLYIENVNLSGKSLKLKGIGGPTVTTIMPSGPGSVVLMDPSVQATIEGFTVAGAYGSGLTAGIRTAGDHPSYIRNCIVRDNGTQAQPANGIYINFHGGISQTTVYGNHRGINLNPFTPIPVSNVISYGNAPFFDIIGESTGVVASLVGSGALPSGSGNITGDPMFWDAVNGDLHLRLSSPCINPAMGALAYEATYAPQPTNYCISAPNSVGAGALISYQGSNSLTANTFHLTVSGTAAGKFGLFFYGAEQAQFPFGDGLGCVSPSGAGGLFRLNPSAATDTTGSMLKHLDFRSAPAAAGPGRILLGSTWNFQFWYRDPLGGSGFNTSNGLSASFSR